MNCSLDLVVVFLIVENHENRSKFSSTGLLLAQYTAKFSRLHGLPFFFLRYGVHLRGRSAREGVPLLTSSRLTMLII